MFIADFSLSCCIVQFAPSVAMVTVPRGMLHQGPSAALPATSAEAFQRDRQRGRCLFWRRHCFCQRTARSRERVVMFDVFDVFCHKLSFAHVENLLFFGGSSLDGRLCSLLAIGRSRRRRGRRLGGRLDVMVVTGHRHHTCHVGIRGARPAMLVFVRLIEPHVLPARSLTGDARWLARSFWQRFLRPVFSSIVSMCECQSTMTMLGRSIHSASPRADAKNVPRIVACQ